MNVKQTAAERKYFFAARMPVQKAMLCDYFVLTTARA
jgi:hypothetical protein